MDKPKTIFLLEDDESFTIVFSHWLREAGFEVISARSIEEAQIILAKIEPPALFWLDYYVNETKTGMDFFDTIRSDARFKDIPVIVVSITVDLKKLDEFKQRGAQETFSKVMTNKDTILAAIKKLVK